MKMVIQILRLAIPSIATFSSMTFTGLLLLMIVGKMGAAPIAIVGITNVLMYNMWALFAGIQGAINYLVAQNFGSTTMRQGNQRMQIALLFSAGISVLVLIASFLTPHALLHIMGANHSILTLGTPYFHVRMAAFMFTIFNTVFYAYFRAIGDTRTPMMISIINSATVVILAYLLGYGKFGFPKMGLQGAAWGFIVAEFVAFVLCASVYFGRLNKVFDTRKWVPIEIKQVKLLFVESAKLGTLELSNSLGMLIFTSCITRLGTVAIAANEIALNILSFGFMPSNGFGSASTISVGQEIGRGNSQLARKLGLITAYLGLGFMALFSICLFLFALPVAKLYTPDLAVYTLALSLIHLASFIQLFNGAGIIFAGGLRGVGDTTFLSRTALILNWVLFIPGTLILTSVFHLGQVGAWTSLCTLNVLQGLANTWRYLKYKWPSTTKSDDPLNPVLNMEDKTMETQTIA